MTWDGFTQTTTQQEKIDSVKNLVLEHFNKKDADRLYALTGTAFKKVLSIEAFRSVCQNNLFPLGDITGIQFEKHTDGINQYKASFQGVDLSMFLGLDSLNKIETFLFQPYQDEQATKSEKPLTSNLLITGLDKKVDQIITPYIRKKVTVGTSIGILKNDKAYYYNYGETSSGNKTLPDNTTIYEIGSITKTFTSFLLADGIRQGKISLNDPVSKYLPDFIGKLEYSGVPITIKSLANHTSGLPRIPSNIGLSAADAVNPYKKYNASMLFEFLKNFKPNRMPGSQYEYSNLGGGLLGTIIERIYNKKFNDLVIEKICIPLQMIHTSQFVTKTDSQLVAKGHDQYGNPASYWDFDALAGAGALRSTVSDLLKFGGANIKTNNKSLDDNFRLTQAVSFSQPAINTKVGLGWHIIKPGNDELLFHNGGTGGFRSFIAINRNKKIVVVILSNTAIGVESEGIELMKWLESQ